MTSLFSAPPATDVPDLTPLRRRNSATRVRPAGPEDVPFLWQLFSDDEISYRWIFRGRTPTLETVRTNLARPNVIPYIAENVATGEAFGYLVAYDINYSNGHTHLGVVIGPEHVGSGAGIMAAILFADYLFAVLPFRKLYMRSIEYSFGQYRGLVDHGYAQVEGVLREHEYFGGRYWDVYILALERTSFMRLRDKVGQR